MERYQKSVAYPEMTLFHEDPAWVVEEDGNIYFGRRQMVFVGHRSVVELSDGSWRIWYASRKKPRS